MAVFSSIQKKWPSSRPSKKSGRPLVHPKKSGRPLYRPSKKSGRPLVHPKKGGFRYRSTHPTTTTYQNRFQRALEPENN